MQPNYVDGPDIPLGLGMALAQNLPAMERFSAMSEEQKQQVIAHTHQLQSKQDMTAYVADIAKGQYT